MAVRVTPGQIVASGDWDALFTQHGGMPQGTPATRRARTEAEMKAAALAGDQDPAAQQRPIYRYVLADGSYVDARTSADGQGWEVVDYQPTQTFTQAQTKAAAVENRTPEETRIAAANATTAENNAVTAQTRAATEQAEANERAWHRDQGHGNYTHKEWADEQAKRDAKTAADTKAAQPTRTIREVKQPDGSTKMVTVLVYPPTAENPQGKEEVLPSAVPGDPKPPPKPPANVSAPSNQRIIEERVDNGDGTFTVTPRKNPNYVKPSKIVPHPSDPNKMVNVTEDDDGNPIILPVDDKTTIKPADLPVLQAKYGEISQGLGALAADLNGRYARGEITEKQRNDAFAAGHQQASTQISEINTILSNSQSAWRQEIEQRGQTLADTASRRSFAGNVLGQAVGTGQALAISSGPGHGKAIAGGVGALLNIGQRYAEGMGGFRESPEIQMPAAVRQAREVNLPGFGGPAAPGVAPLPVSGSGSQVSGGIAPSPETRNPTPETPAAASPPVIPFGTAPTQTTDAGGVPRVTTPAIGGPPQPLPERNGVPVTSTPSGGTPAPQAVAPGGWGALNPPGAGAPPQPGGWGALNPPGANPLVQHMQQQLMGASGFAGTPAAAGGAGVFDPLAEAERMLGSRAPDDVDWGEAVRLASEAINQPRQPAWQRFSS